MDENKLRVMIDREEALEAKCALLAASLKQADKLTAAVQAILAKAQDPMGPSKADTIAQLVELFGGAPFVAALEHDPITALMERVDRVWMHHELMTAALADVRRMVAEMEAAKGGAA